MIGKVRCYDNGGQSFDQYTVVFVDKLDGEYMYLGMSENPHHPQGFCQHGFANRLIDEPGHLHLGVRISYEDLPDACKKQVLHDLKLIYESND